LVYAAAAALLEHCTLYRYPVVFSISVSNRQKTPVFFFFFSLSAAKKEEEEAG